MTLPDERSRAIRNTRDFLRSLLDPKQTPRVPRSIRLQARSCLKHYPWDSHLDDVSDWLPSIFGPLDRERTD